MKIFILSARQQPSFDDAIGYFHVPPSKIGNGLREINQTNRPIRLKPRFLTNRPIRPKPRRLRKINRTDLLSARQQPPFDDAIRYFDAGFSSYGNAQVLPDVFDSDLEIF